VRRPLQLPADACGLPRAVRAWAGGLLIDAGRNARGLVRCGCSWWAQAGRRADARPGVAGALGGAQGRGCVPWL